MNRYVVALDGYGRLFMQSLRNFGIDDTIRDDATGKTLVQYVYSEIITQIFMHYEATPEIFLARLQTLPLFPNLRHVSNLQDRNIAIAFGVKCREFGFAVYTQLKRFVPMTPELDYLLEAFTPDYIVILEIPTITDATEIL